MFEDESNIFSQITWRSTFTLKHWASCPTTKLHHPRWIVLNCYEERNKENNTSSVPFYLIFYHMKSQCLFEPFRPPLLWSQILSVSPAGKQLPFSSLLRWREIESDSFHENILNEVQSFTVPASSALTRNAKCTEWG